jgi:hypothetical protein
LWNAIRGSGGRHGAIALKPDQFGRGNKARETDVAIDKKDGIIRTVVTTGEPQGIDAGERLYALWGT